MGDDAPLRLEDLPKEVERRQLSEHHRAVLLNNGCLVIAGAGIETILGAEEGHSLLNLLYNHKALLKVILRSL